MVDKFLNLFLQFMIYSFLGYIIEVISCTIREKKLTLNRGFFLGPYLPIYGFSCILMSIAILRYKSDLFTLFVMSAFICTAVEYLTSYIMEKIFKARWWDYSDRKFNLEGRVCLFNSLLFGIGGIIFAYLLNPFVNFLINLMPILVFRIVSIVLLVIFSLDIILTVRTLYQVKISSLKFKSRDATQEITKLIREELTKKRDIKTNFFIMHLLNAFPEINISDYTNPLSKLKRYTLKVRRKKKNKETNY